MSGFAGIFNLDGAPVDRRVLEDLASFLSFRGPDAQSVWSDASVGLAHALLRTTRESACESQPLTLDGRVWIAADARIDAREDLVSALGAPASLLASPDVELVLHAYLRWGEECLEHLLGDFAFAIWDAHRRRIFCARDQLGVRQLFYTVNKELLIFSNSIRCLRRHPAVSNTLNDLAIADFLLFEWIQDADATSFADIRRLPAGHCLVCDAGSAPSVHRYWQVSEGREIRYRRPSDYLERFRELMDRAVTDRLRTDKAAIFLSGGLDSPTIAAFARPRAELEAITVVYDHLIPDDERYYSGLVAKHLDIPINYLSADDYRLYERAGTPEGEPPEPAHWPTRAIALNMYEQAGSICRVVLAGDGGDEVLRPVARYLESRVRTGELGALARDLSHALQLGMIPRGLGLRASLSARLRHAFAPLPDYPMWIEPGLETALRLRDRWNAVWTAHQHSTPMTHRIQTRRFIEHPIFRYFVSAQDADWTAVPIEIRFPFLDRRLFEFATSLPFLPWCQSKRLVRESMRTRLPGTILNRPKTPVRYDPALVRLSDIECRSKGRLLTNPRVSRYVSVDVVSPPRSCSDLFRFRLDLHPLSLDYWLYTV